jgi:hypothetical protein
MGNAFRLAKLLVIENPNRSAKSIREEIEKMTGINLDGRVIGGEKRILIYRKGKAA